MRARCQKSRIFASEDYVNSVITIQLWSEVSKCHRRSTTCCIVGTIKWIDREYLVVAKSVQLGFAQKASVVYRGTMVDYLQEGLVLI